MAKFGQSRNFWSYIVSKECEGRSMLTNVIEIMWEMGGNGILFVQLTSARRAGV